MADIADLAQADMERDAPHVIANSKKPAGPVPDGHCHYCGEGVLPDTPFCDAECRDAWQHEQRLRAINGRES